MTEDEAKTKWCPFVRAVVGVDTIAETGGPTLTQNTPVFNRVIMSGNLVPWSPTQSNCIGPTCMAWRCTKKSKTAKAVSEGYCGLAGRP
jgi:hypothetical protein